MTSHHNRCEVFSVVKNVKALFNSILKQKNEAVVGLLPYNLIIKILIEIREALYFTRWQYDHSHVFIFNEQYQVW